MLSSSKRKPSATPNEIPNTAPVTGAAKNNPIAAAPCIAATENARVNTICATFFGALRLVSLTILIIESKNEMNEANLAAKFM